MRLQAPPVPALPPGFVSQLAPLIMGEISKISTFSIIPALELYVINGDGFGTLLSISIVATLVSVTCVQACVVTKGNPNQRGVLAVDGGRTNGVERNMYALRLEASSSRLKASDLRGL
jgi:hypothetical protein